MEQYMDNNEVLFCEHYSAAQSLKNNWTRLASTYGCMMIVLSRKMLMIKPHWFAKWLINPLNLDLRHEIPIASIRDVRRWGNGSVMAKWNWFFSRRREKSKN
jgi:hypothetical protein